MATAYRRTRRRFEIDNQARFLTFSCYQRLELFQNDEIKNTFVHDINRARNLSNCKLLGWVIMPEHIHLLVIPYLPEFPIPTVLKHLKGSFANTVLKRWRELKAPVLSKLTDTRGKLHFWQKGGGYDRNIRSDEEFFEKLNYIHNNPVIRGLVKCPSGWMWSSAMWYEGDRDKSLLKINEFAP